MQTFVTRFSDRITAEDLDDLRLNKQILETKQILTSLITGVGFPHHPATKMWTGYELALCNYGATCAWVLHQRSGTVHMYAHDFNTIAKMPEIASVGHTKPPWRNDTDVLISHRSNLIRKLPERYAELFPDQAPGLPYLWPVLQDKDTNAYELYISAAEMGRIRKDGVNTDGTPYTVPENWDIGDDRKVTIYDH